MFVLVILPLVAVRLIVPLVVFSEPDIPSEAPVKSIVPPVAVIDEPALEVSAAVESALNVPPLPAADEPVKFNALVDVR